MRLSLNTGQYVSGAGHAVFILYLAIGGLFFARETDMEVSVSNVSIISGEEFAAMQAQSPGEGERPPAPEAPAPAVTPEASAPVPEAPAPVEELAPEPDPVVPDPAPPVEVPPAPEQPDAPEVDGDPGAVTIAPDARPVPRAADRVAEEAVEPPDPEVKVDEVEQAATAPQAAVETVVEEAQEATAPEEATTEIVTEADEPESRAPTQSTRPGRKPAAPVRPAAPQVAEVPTTPTEQPATEQPAVPGLEDLINNAVREANETPAVADTAIAGGGTSSPLTRAEKGAMTLGIQRCWNVGALGTDALAVAVVVGFSMEPDGKPNTGSIRMISSTGGSGDAVARAYEAARRAIIRCGATGFEVPLDKYDQWRDVEVNFDATNKEIR